MLSVPVTVDDKLREIGDMSGLKQKDLPSATPFAQIADTASYPSGSLDFLVKLREQAKDSYPVHSRVKLRIGVVGAGLGGLSAAISLVRKGHTVTVFEQAPALGEVGAGIQIPSNSSQLLIKWGIEPFWNSNVVEPQAINFRRWETGEVIGHTNLVPNFRQDFAAPYYVVHRAHFHRALHQLALSLGVDVRINSKVRSYDADTPSITLEDGRVETADLIIAADGVKSTARDQVLGHTDSAPRLTGFAAYRATVDVEKMKSDPDVAWLLTNPSLHVWIGDMRHVMSYTIAGGKSFNMVLSHPDRSDPCGWSQETALVDMRNHFRGWDQRLTKLINMISSTMKWPLLTGQTLDRWVAPSSRLLIMGDAAHAMVPYMSQGAAMAVEDAAALAEALDQAANVSETPTALRVWEQVRIVRTSQMQEASLINGRIWHFADGPEQRARDAAMRPEVEGRYSVSSPNQWTDPTTQRWCYGYDAERAVRDAFPQTKTEHRRDAQIKL